MGASTRLNGTLSDFILRQTPFFAASAGAEGRVGAGPKGLDPRRILAPDRIVCLDVSGGGNETAAHVRENGA